MTLWCELLVKKKKSPFDYVIDQWSFCYRFFFFIFHRPSNLKGGENKGKNITCPECYFIVPLSWLQHSWIYFPFFLLEVNTLHGMLYPCPPLTLHPNIWRVFLEGHGWGSRALKLEQTSCAKLVSCRLTCICNTVPSHGQLLHSWKQEEYWCPWIP